MSKSVVLDSSAILALANEETGADLVRSVIFRSVISAVTLAEVLSVFSLMGPDELAALDEILFAIAEVIPFSTTQAKIAGELRRTTKSLGLSLGDRACLALALELGSEAYTCDRAWAQADVGCTIHLIR